jgi:glycosyltransferase involved in cell wall biosynthesis
MRVLQMISSGGFYGAERMVIQLSAALQEMDCRTMLAVFRNESREHLEVAERALEAGLHVEEIPCRGRFDRRTVARIRELAREFGADVVHCHGYKPNFYAWVALHNAGPKLMSTCHLYTDETLPLRFYGWLDRRILRRYDAVSAVSEAERNRVLRSGVRAEKVKVINNGIDCAAFTGARPSILYPGALLVGTVGRLTAQKNPVGILAAAREAVRAGINAHFVYVGDGPDRQKLESLRNEWGMEGRVDFLGFRPDMPNIYASLDLFVLPSMDEGLPMALLECMAAGTPVIATRVGAVEKVVRDGETGLLVNPGDQTALNSAVLRLLEDRNLAQSLGAKGQRRVREHFSSEAMARNYLEIYSG